MEDVKACLVCLEMNTTLFSLHTNSLQQYYEFLTGTHFTKKFKVPMFVCFQCKAMLIKFYIFRQKSFRAQAVLQSILQSHGQISAEKIRQIDTARYLLNSNLSVVTAFSVSITGTDISESKIKIERDDKFEYRNLYDDIKVEFDNMDDVWLGNEKPRKSKKSIEQNIPINMNIVKEEVEMDFETLENGLERQGTLSIVNTSESVAMPLTTYGYVNPSRNEENQIDDRLKRRRELTKARVKKYRNKLRSEFLQMNASTQNDLTALTDQAKEHNAEHKKALAKERSRRYREKKRLSKSGTLGVNGS